MCVRWGGGLEATDQVTSAKQFFEYVFKVRDEMTVTIERGSSRQCCHVACDKRTSAVTQTDKAEIKSNSIQLRRVSSHSVNPHSIDCYLSSIEINSTIDSDLPTRRDTDITMTSCLSMYCTALATSTVALLYYFMRHRTANSDRNIEKPLVT